MRANIENLLSPLHALHFYGAAGIAAFGWAVGCLLGWEPAPFLGLWFCAALLIYNVDRLRPDPADRLNVPRRAAASRRLQRASRAVVTGAAAFLLGWPLWQRDWLTLALVLGGGFICLGYSFPIFGLRLKEVPLLKTLLAPSVVTAAVIVLPWFQQGWRVPAPVLAMTTAAAWCALLFNMLLCDLRDLRGDGATGVLSLPGWLGERGTKRLLFALLLTLEALVIALLLTVPAPLVPAWQLIALGSPLYLGALLFAVRRPRSEAFFEWWVEGILFLPALAVGLTR